MSRNNVPAALQRRIRERACDRCEYCRLAQVGQEATFPIDHIRPGKCCNRDSAAEPQAGTVMGR